MCFRVQATAIWWQQLGTPLSPLRGQLPSERGTKLGETRTSHKCVSTCRLNNTIALDRGRNDDELKEKAKSDSGIEERVTGPAWHPLRAGRERTAFITVASKRKLAGNGRRPAEPTNDNSTTAQHAHTAVTVATKTMAARAVCESPPAIQQPVALNDNNNNVSTMMSAIGIGRDSTPPTRGQPSSTHRPNAAATTPHRPRAEELASSAARIRQTPAGCRCNAVHDVLTHS